MNNFLIKINLKIKISQNKINKKLKMKFKKYN